LAKSQRHCPECGAKQDADKRYFPPEGQEIKVEGHKYEGADRYCPNCKNPQSALGKNCQNCGAPMDGSAQVKGVATPAPPPKKKSKRWLFILIAVVVGIVGIVAGVKYCNRTKEADAKITAHRWQREVPIEEYDDVRHSEWRERVPVGARSVMCTRTQRSTKKVPDGEECRDEKHDKKDGTFEIVKKCKTKYRSEPVMDDKCTYTVTEWHQVDNKTASGTGTSFSDPPGLPPAAVAPVPRVPRAGHARDTRYLDLDIPKVGAQSCSVSDSVWAKYKDGQAVKIQIKVRNDEVDCDSL